MGIELNYLKRLIVASYSIDDLDFAVDSSCSANARVAISEAVNQHVGLTQYLRLHREFLESKDCFDEHIEEQLDKVRDIAYYFDFT